MMFSLPFSPHHSATLLITYTILSLLTIITLSMAYNHCDARDAMLESTRLSQYYEQKRTDGRTADAGLPTYLLLFNVFYTLSQNRIRYLERKKATNTNS